MEEMMEETLDSVDDDELEEEADAEVDKVLYELTDGKLGQAGRVGGELPVSHLEICMLILGGKGGRGRCGRDAENAKGDGGFTQWLMYPRIIISCHCRDASCITKLF
jgi:hypothetical protein